MPCIYHSLSHHYLYLKMQKWNNLLIHPPTCSRNDFHDIHDVQGALHADYFICRTSTIYLTMKCHYQEFSLILLAYIARRMTLGWLGDPFTTSLPSLTLRPTVFKFIWNETLKCNLNLNLLRVVVEGDVEQRDVRHKKENENNGKIWKHFIIIKMVNRL